MRRQGQDRKNAELPGPATREVELRASLLGLREELVGLLGKLDAMRNEEAEEAATPSQVTVHRAVLAPVRRGPRDRDRCGAARSKSPPPERTLRKAAPRRDFPLPTTEIRLVSASGFGRNSRGVAQPG